MSTTKTKAVSPESEASKNPLVWRLNKALSLEDVEHMLEKKIIDESEAKSLLFSTQDKREAQVELKALKEQVRFLEETLVKVINKLSPSHTVTWSYLTPVYPTVYWSHSPAITSTGQSNGTFTCSSYSVNTGTNQVSYKTIN